jgi:ubiquinol-cytochrome c reductase cytochrome b subunit
MQTPISIVPEFYLLPFYAILRAIPNKLLGVVAMLAAIFILFLLPYLESSRVRSSAFRPFMRIFFWLFAVNFLLLMWIGANHPEPPFILLGQLCTAFYFAYFLILVPLIGLIENTLSDLGTINPSKNTPQGLFSVENRGNYIPRITFRAFQQRLFLIMGIYRRKVNS